MAAEDISGDISWNLDQLYNCIRISRIGVYDPLMELDDIKAIIAGAITTNESLRDI